MIFVRHLRLAILLYAALVAQTALVPEWSVSGSSPRFVALVVVAAVLTLEGWPGIAWSAAAGLASDCLTAGPLGIGMLAATLIATLVQRLRGERPVESVWLTTLIAFLTVWAITLLAASLRLAVSPAALEADRLLRGTLAGAGFSALLVFALAALRRILARLTARPLEKTQHSGQVNRWDMLTS